MKLTRKQLKKLVRQAIKETVEKQEDVKYQSPNDLENKFTKEGFPQLGKFASIELNDILQQTPELKELRNNQVKLEKDITNLKLHKSSVQNRKDGSYTFPKNPLIQAEYDKLNNQLKQNQEELSEFVKNTIQPFITKFENIKNGDMNAINSFIKEIQGSTMYQGVTRAVNVVVELVDKGIVPKEKETELINYLKNKKSVSGERLLERKYYIKLANILF